MNTNEFLKELKAAGCLFKRHGGNHDLWVNPATGAQAPVPRHREIGDSLCKLIRKQLGIKSN